MSICHVIVDVCVQEVLKLFCSCSNGGLLSANLLGALNAEAFLVSFKRWIWLRCVRGSCFASPSGCVRVVR